MNCIPHGLPVIHVMYSASLYAAGVMPGTALQPVLAILPASSDGTRLLLRLLLPTAPILCVSASSGKGRPELPNSAFAGGNALQPVLAILTASSDGTGLSLQLPLIGSPLLCPAAISVKGLLELPSRKGLAGVTKFACGCSSVAEATLGGC